MSITNEDVLAELERERAVRKRVYGNMVLKEQMRQDTYEHRMACIERAIAIMQATCQQQELGL